MSVIRKEFLRAYTIFARTTCVDPIAPTLFNDSIPDVINPSEVFDFLFEEADDPFETKKV